MSIEHVVILSVMTQTGTASQPAPASTSTPAASARPTAAAGMPGESTNASSGGTAGTLQPGSSGGAAPAPQQAPMGGIFWILPLMLIVMVGMSLMAGRKDKKKREELMKSLQKGDKVMTTGGMIGHITELSDTEAVLRVEDGRIRITRNAIQGVMESKRGGAAIEAKPDAKAVV